jgi:hypothetical protein
MLENLAFPTKWFATAARAKKLASVLTENKLGLWRECRNTAGVIWMEMREEDRLGMNVQPRQLCRQIRVGLLPITH